MKKRALDNNKLRGGITIHLTNRWLYSLIVFGIILIVAVGVYASSPTGSIPNPGHSLSQIQTCGTSTSGKILETTAAGTWDCVDPSSVSGQWTSSTNGIYYSAGSVGVGGSPDSYNWDPLVLNKNSIALGFYAGSFLSGGSGASLGTETNNALHFFTNHVDRVAIDASGNVGIGTMTPKNPLNVVGNANVTGTIYSGEKSVLTTSNLPPICGTGLVLTYTINGWSCVSSGGGSVWTTSGSDIYYVLGNVGIGTSSLSSRLSVAGDLNVTGNLVSSSGGWTNVTTFTSNWQTIPSNPVQYKKFGDMVFLRGAARNATAYYYNGPVFTLPSGFRPSITRNLEVYCLNTVCPMSVSNNGDVYVSSSGIPQWWNGFPSSNLYGYVYFDGVSFSTG